MTTTEPRDERKPESIAAEAAALHVRRLGRTPRSTI